MPFPSKKIKAQSLSVVITIALCIGLLLGGMLVLATFYSKAKDQFGIERRLIQNWKSALNYCLVQKEIPNKFTLDLFDQKQDSVYYQSIPFGILNYARISAFHGSDSVTKTCLLGSKNTIQDKLSLYLANSNKALGVCGKTLLNGDVKIPERGIERTYIEGQNFVGRQLYNGTKTKSTNSIPQLGPDILSNINLCYESNGLIPFPEDADSIISKNNLVYFSSNEVILIDQFIRGIVIIESQQKIIVSNQANLSNTIIKAPVVVFESNFKGSLQAFATDSIITGRDCTFNYPTYLVLKPGAQPNFAPKIDIGKDNLIKGNLIALQERFNLKNNNIITINHNSIVNGTVYSQGYTQLKSCKIEGDLYTQKLYLKTPSSVYENQLLNVTIDKTKLDSNHLDIGLINQERTWIRLD
jgi:hypothetical protein